jgi:hypothetical protein
MVDARRFWKNRFDAPSGLDSAEGNDMTSTLLATVTTALAGIIVAAITGLLSYRSARWSLRKDLEVDLRRQRLEAFKALWALSEPLAKYGRTGPAAKVTPASMEKLSGDLRHWYFAQGGMFLTDQSRDAYFSFQDALQEVIQGAADMSKELDEEARERIREPGSTLRTSLRSAFKGFPRM